MEFLDYSQTFIGVLTSLVVLCVIINSSNFIHEILKKIGDKIDEEIDSLDHTINIEAAYDKAVKGQAPYKLLQKFIEDPWESKQNKGNKQEDLYSNALQLDMKLKASFDNFKSEYSPKFIKPARTLIKTVKDSREQVISPLYVLLYCLVIFICDEIVYNIPNTESFIVTFLTVFTILSLGLWTALWCSFIKDIKIIPEGSENKESKKHKVETWICNHSKWINTTICITILSIIFFYISMLIPNIIIGRITFIIGIFIPIFIVAICRIRSHPQLGEYFYMFAFKHFFGLLFLSFLVALVPTIFAVFNNDILQVCFEYGDFVAIKFTIISFIIINGLLLPFIVPFKGFYRILKLVKKEVETTQTKLDNELKEIITQLNNFCSKL